MTQTREVTMAANRNFDVGKLAEFGGYEWRVLEVRDGKALLLSREVIRTDTYNPSDGHTSWDICALRDWLNIDFYEKFSEQEQSRIVETSVTTAKNPRFETDCGETVTDNVFLLSVEEVARYFGDSGQLQGGNPKSKWWINDQYNAERIAYGKNGTAAFGIFAAKGAAKTAQKLRPEAAAISKRAALVRRVHWWWLRTPGMHGNTAVYINTGGSINLAGHRAYNGDGGVRPALWVTL
jgi:hypothetical protein